MTWSAPTDRTRSTLRVLHTPVTLAPKALAICTANVPTPPDAPVTSTVCPGCTLAISRSACRAVKADTGIAAACSMLRLTGFGAKIVRWGAGVLGQGSGAAPAEHRITWLQSLHAPADRLHP